MAAQSFVLRKVHINFLVTAPILEMLNNMTPVSNKFDFLTSEYRYLSYYQQRFIKKCRENKTNKATKQFPHAFIKGLGILLPVGGHELKQPPFEALNHGLVKTRDLKEPGKWMLPLKVTPNWKLNLNPKVLGKYSNLSFHFEPLIKIYPFGMLAYHIRLTISGRYGIKLYELINIISSILHNKGVKLTNPNPDDKERYELLNIEGIVKKFHKIILQNVFEPRYRVDVGDIGFSKIHRIITIESLEEEIDPKVRKKELAAIILLEPYWNVLSDEVISNNAGKHIACRYAGQFIIFHPSCSIINPYKIIGYPNKVEYKSCMRDNFTSIVEVAIIQNNYAQTLDMLLDRYVNEIDLALNEPDFLLYLISMVKHSKLLDVYSDLYGYRRNVLNIIAENIALSKNLDQSKSKLNTVLDSIKRALLSSSDDKHVLSVIKSNVENMYQVCRKFSYCVDQLEDTSKHPKLEQELNAALTIRDLTENVASELSSIIDIYDNIKEQRSVQDDKVITIRRSLLRVVSDYYENVLPNFEEFVKSIVDNESELKEINSKINDDSTSMENISKELEKARNVFGKIIQSKYPESAKDFITSVPKTKSYVNGLLEVTEMIVALITPLSIRPIISFAIKIFKDIHGSTIIDESLVKNSFNEVKKAYDVETILALLTVAQYIHKSKEPAAGQLFNEFCQELSKPSQINLD